MDYFQQTNKPDTPPPQSGRDRRDASRVAEHLPVGYTAEFSGESSTANSPATLAPQPAEDSQEESSLKLQGGDIHRALFRQDARTKLQSHKRSNTFHHPTTAGIWDEDEDEGPMPVHEQIMPQGFRRQFIQDQQRNNFAAARIPIARDFVEFLDLYGNFAGEYLHESDDEAITDDEPDETDTQPGETRPLLGRRRSTRPGPSATAGMWKTFFTLVKAFIGTGIMFLPKAFDNGGLLFSSITLVVISFVTMWAFHLLLACKKQFGGGYGEIGLAIAGTRMRGLILASITLSQLGFVSTGIVFVAENLSSFLRAVVDGESPLSATGIILIQLVLLTPLAFIRNIAKLGPFALLADVCILVGLTYIYYYDIGTLATEGLSKSVVMFNPERYTLTIGAVIFTFEGIGLILPIQSSMAKPQRFEWLLAVVMVLITIIYTSVGFLCYATFGADTKIEVIDNFPQDNKLVNAIQFLYSLAILVGTPVQLFPALRILEGKIFGHRSGKQSVRTKWNKNAFRTGLVLLCGTVSILGAGNLDRFVALIGSFACVPLVYIYPPYLHYKGVATSTQAKMADLFLIVAGSVAMVYTTMITVVNSFM